MTNGGDHSTDLPPALPDTIPSPPFWLSAAGLTPIIGLTGVMFFGSPGMKETAEAALSAYAIVILAFMGGVHWGLTMQVSHTSDVSILWQRYGVSVTPPLVGWAAVFIPQPLQFALLAIAFALLLSYDLRAVRQGDAPHWYRKLRWPLSVCVVTFLGLAAIASS